MIVTCDTVTLSIIGPADGWENDPNYGPYAELFEKLTRMMGLPSTKVYGDGKDYWEVSAKDTANGCPVLIEGWSQWRLPEPLSGDEWSIYGWVPTGAILHYIEQHGGTPEFHLFVGVSRGLE